MGRDRFRRTPSSTFALMESYETVDDLANAELENISAFLHAASRGRFANPDETAKIIQAAARGSYRLPKTVNDSVNQAMSVSIAGIRALQGQIKELEAAIQKQFEIILNTIISVPGIGKVYSAGIIAEIGDIRRFQSHASVANTPASSGINTSQAYLTLRTPVSLNPATVSCVTTCWKLRIP